MMPYRPLSREMRALLDTIASTEAPDYNVMYGGSRFDSYADHPRVFHEIQSGPNRGQRSSAAGRYQFLGSTWDDIAGRYGIQDFTPPSQDYGAAMLATENYRRLTGRDLEADLASRDPAVLANVGRTLSPTWTSLPSGIEQGQGVDKFTATFMASLDDPTAGSDYNASISTRMASAAQQAGKSEADYLASLREEAVGAPSADEGVLPQDDPYSAAPRRRYASAPPFTPLPMGPSVISTLRS